MNLQSSFASPDVLPNLAIFQSQRSFDDTSSSESSQQVSLLIATKRVKYSADLRILIFFAFTETL
jgi:hypothetical protein